MDRLVDRDYTESPSSERTKKREAPDKEKKGEGVISEPEVNITQTVPKSYYPYSQ